MHVKLGYSFFLFCLIEGNQVYSNEILMEISGQYRH